MQADKQKYGQSMPFKHFKPCRRDYYIEHIRAAFTMILWIPIFINFATEQVDNTVYT